MARTESRTKTAIWQDEEFCSLAGSAQRMYWLLYSQPTINLCGVLALTVKRWAALAADETEQTVRDALSALERADYIVVDENTEEVWVRTFIRHDGVCRSPKTADAARGQLGTIMSMTIRKRAEAELDRELGKVLVDTPSGTGVDTPTDRSRTRACADSSLQPQPLTPSSDPLGSPPNGEGLDAPHQGLGLERLITRTIASCTARDKSILRQEAVDMVAWASRFVDSKIIDEEIGRYASRPERPTFPEAIAVAIRERAKSVNIPMPAFVPQRKARGVSPPIGGSFIHMPNLSAARAIG